MSLNLGVISAAVTLDDSDYRKKLSGIEAQSETSFKKVAALAAGYLSFRAIYSSGSMAIKTFSDMEEAANRFNMVYGDIKNTATQTMQELRKEFGLSRGSAYEMLAGTGDLLTGFGFDQMSALKLSEQAAKLGADLYSFTNYAGGAKGATEALTKGMLGETESLKSLGVVIRQDSDEYKNLVKEIRATKGVTEQQAKAMAVLELATRQSKNAIGDWNRPGETFAQVAQAGKETIKEFSAILGGQFQDGVKGGLKGINELLGGYNNLAPANQRMITGGVALAAGLLLTQTNTVKAANAKMMLAGRYLATADAARLESVATVAAEKQKELATARSVATRDMLEKRRHLTAMQNAAKEAAAAFRQTRAGGDQAAITAAEKRYTVAKLEASKANAAFVVSSQAAKEAKRAEAVQTELTTRAQLAANRAKTAGGRAALILSGGLKTAAISLKAFFASLGPIGWAMLAFGGIGAIINLVGREAEQAVEKARKLSEEAGVAVEKNNARNQSIMSQFKRLETLSNYERLNNSEMTQAKNIISELGLAHEKYGVRIDETTKRIIFQKKSLRELMEEEKKKLTQERVDVLKKQAEAKLAEYNANEKKAEGGYGRAFADVAAKNWRGVGGLWLGHLFKSNDEVSSAQASDQKKRLEEWQAIMAEISKLKNGAITIEMNEEEIAAANEEIRKLQDRIKDKKFDLKLTSVESAAEKLPLLESQIKEIEEEKLQARGDQKKELEAELKLLDLQKERLSLIKEQKGEQKEIRQSEYEYQKTLRDRKKFLAEQTLDRRLDKMLRDGDRGGAKSLMESEYATAKAAAARMKSEYQKARDEAVKDGYLSDREKLELARIKEKWQEAISREDKWSGKLYDQEKRDQSQKKTIVTFSAELLGLAAGSNSPQERTAKAVEKSQKTLQDIKDNTKPKTTTTQNNTVKAT